MFRKLIGMILLMSIVVGCTSTTDPDPEPVDTAIKVYARDGSSGTREAFEAVIGLDSLTNDSAETTSNGDMATQVGANDNGIGYVSLTTDFAANSLKALDYEGVEPTVANVIDGSYQLSRPFSYVTRASGDFANDETEALVAAFIDYVSNSVEGRQIVFAEGGIVDVSGGTAWSELKVNHPIVDQDNSGLLIKLAGSTSVARTITAALESFVPLAGNFTFEPNQTGSSDGFKRVLGDEKDGPNAADIGFASRAFNDSETVADGAFSGVYSLDAVVVVVNADNEYVSDLSADQLVEIFSGEATSWTDL